MTPLILAGLLDSTIRFYVNKTSLPAAKDKKNIILWQNTTNNSIRSPKTPKASNQPTATRITMDLYKQVIEAVSRSQVSSSKVSIRALRSPESWGAEKEAYCVHIRTHKYRKPNAENIWDCEENKQEKKDAEDLADAIESLGKLGDRELFGDTNFYTRQVYVGDRYSSKLKCG